MKEGRVMKLRFKQSHKDNSVWVELENKGKIMRFSEAEVYSFIQNKEVNKLIFSDDMSKEYKINLKLMLDSLINKILKDV